MPGLILCSPDVPPVISVQPGTPGRHCVAVADVTIRRVDGGRQPGAPSGYRAPMRRHDLTADVVRGDHTEPNATGRSRSAHLSLSVSNSPQAPIGGSGSQSNELPMMKCDGIEGASRRQPMPYDDSST